MKVRSDTIFNPPEWGKKWKGDVMFSAGKDAGIGTFLNYW